MPKKKPRGNYLSTTKLETSQELDNLIDKEFVSRTVATALLWRYLKRTGFNTESKRVKGKTITYILPYHKDAIEFFGKKKIKITEVPKILSAHLHKTD